MWIFLKQTRKHKNIFYKYYIYNYYIIIIFCMLIIKITGSRKKNVCINISFGSTNLGFN